MRIKSDEYVLLQTRAFSAYRPIRRFATLYVKCVWDPTEHAVHDLTRMVGPRALSVLNRVERDRRKRRGACPRVGRMRVEASTTNEVLRVAVALGPDRELPIGAALRDGVWTIVEFGKCRP